MKLGVLIAALLTVLIFFSKTIYTYNLPLVTATAPLNGRLNKEEVTRGVAEWENIVEIYAETGGTVESVEVSEGGTVTEGQAIMTMSFDEEDTLQRLSELEVARARNALEVENINLRLANIDRKVEELNSETYETDSGAEYELRQLELDLAKAESDYEALKRDQEAKAAQERADHEYELERAQEELDKAEEEYGRLEILYNAGSAARQDLENSGRALKSQRDTCAKLRQTLEDKEAESLESHRKALENAEYNIDNLRRKRENTRKVLDEGAADWEEARAKQLKDYEYEKQQLSQEIKTKELDRQGLEIQEAAYRRILRKYSDSLVITGGTGTSGGAGSEPENSTVIELNVKEGQYVNAKQLLASFGVGSAFKVVCPVSLDNNFTIVGDSCELSNASRVVEGVVTKITLAENHKEVTVSIKSEPEVTAGETFDISFEKESGKSYILVANGAVNRDSDGYFLYQIKRREGIMGKEFYTAKRRVYIGDSDAEYTVITGGVDFFEPVALLSDKPFYEDETIKLKNESDFFVD
ncbi:MAG: hypothetical protein LBS62_01785 [Clostridiales bacterium]|nr:hypothetical protein [Clostridiales bacterium]